MSFPSNCQYDSFDHDWGLSLNLRQYATILVLHPKQSRTHCGPKKILIPFIHPERLISLWTCCDYITHKASLFSDCSLTLGCVTLYLLR